MKQAGEPMEKIMKYTQLTPEEVEALCRITLQMHQGHPNVKRAKIAIGILKYPRIIAI